MFSWSICLLKIMIKLLIVKSYFPAVLHFMTAVAIFLYAEGLFPLVMAGAAGFRRLHLGHRNASLVLCRGEVKLCVAVSALVEARVKFMAEFDVARIFQFVFHVLDGMTLRAFIDFECPFAVMTGTAGEPLFHLGHRDPALVLCRGEVELDVTIAALVKPV